MERCASDDRDEAANKISEIAGTAGFERKIDICSMCCISKKVTRRVPS